MISIAALFGFSAALVAQEKAPDGHARQTCSHSKEVPPAAAKCDVETAGGLETYSLKDRAPLPAPPANNRKESSAAAHAPDDGRDHGQTSPVPAAGHSVPDGHDHSDGGPRNEHQYEHEHGHDHGQTPSASSSAGHSATGAGDHSDKTAINIEGLVEEKARVETVYETVSANAVVRFHPDHYAKIAPFVPGRVRRIIARLGDRVKKGQELVVIESVEIFNAKVEYLKNLSRYEVALAKYENIVKMGELGSFTQKNVEEAQAALAEARSQHEKALVARAAASKKLDRVKKLVDSGVSSRSELEAAENDFRSASIEVASAASRLSNAEKSMTRESRLSDGKISLKKEMADIQTEFYEARQNYEISRKYLEVVGVECEPGGPCREHDLGTFSIYSPIDGIVIENYAVIGGSVDPQTPVMCVGDYDRVAIDIDIYEKDLAKVKTGQLVEIDNIYGRPVSGKITYVSNILEPNTRTLKARAAIDANPELLKIGEFVNCSIHVAERPGAVTIPQSAVIEDAGRFIVFVKCGKSYDKVAVKPGFKSGDRVEITEGIGPQAVVVTVGNYQLLNASLSTKLELSCDSCK